MMADFAQPRDDDNPEFRLTVEQRQRARAGRGTPEAEPDVAITINLPRKIFAKFHGTYRGKDHRMIGGAEA